MSETAAAIEAGGLSVRFDTSSGLFDLALGGFSLPGLAAGLETAAGEFRAGQLTWAVAEHQADRLAVTGEAAGVSLTLSFELRAETPPELVLSADVRSPRPFALERVVLAQAESVPAPEWLFADGEAVATLDAAGGGDFSRAGLMAWTTAGRTLLFTFPVRQSFLCGADGRLEDGRVAGLRIDCAVGLDDVADPVRVPPLTLCVTDAPHEHVETFGDRQRAPAMRPIRPAPVAWNSWDYIVNLVSADYVVRNMERIAADPVLGEAVEAIVIDDGWEHLYGEWEPNYRFPDGMAAIARRITGAGFQAGLWFAPAIVENTSVNAYWNEHLLARGRSHLPCCAYECMLRYGFALDITRPAARAWLIELFQRYREMGFTYFKLDFLKQMTAAELFGGRRVAKGDLVGEVVAAVREAVGDDCHLLGSNYLTASGPGRVDSNRISGDIAPRFGIVRRNAPYLAGRYWQHGRLWWNDPDFALCRGPDTSDDPDIDRIHVCNIYVSPRETAVAAREPFLSIVEARTLLSLVLLSGGSITLGDDLTRLNEAGLDLLRRTVTAARGGAARPIDLFTSELPEHWVQPLPGGYRIGLINFSDEPATRRIDLVGRVEGDWAEGREFWTGRAVPVAGGSVSVDLAPHETALIELTASASKAGGGS
ncbi:MAG: alpha-galactosidase [Planctomycetota bacterium]